MEIKPEFKKKDIRSYVIRGGRITSGQKRAFDAHWSNYGLSLFAGKLNFDSAFGRVAPIVLEIGFGMGDSLLAMARQEPEKDFIGVEVHPPGVGHLLASAAEAGVSNLKIFMADAVDVLDDCIAPSSVDRCQIYFPDPWHKKKHHKRRIVQRPFIDRIHNVIKPEGVLHLATDWEQYADHMMEVMSTHEGFVNEAGEYLFSARPDYRPITKFEKRGERLGHGVWDLLFRRQAN